MQHKEINILNYGNSKELPVKINLKAGFFDVVYDNGSLRYISYGSNELVRSIYSAVRDQNWGTIIPQITNETIENNIDSFKIKYKALYKRANIEFEAQYTFTGNANGSIIATIEGKALTTFLKNRIGFCVLHPILGVSGKSCEVTHSNNQKTSYNFPQQISPVAPMKDICQMQWTSFGNNCTLKFEGDIWEMEDQRNWTDTSYKTFCTPLEIPYPAEIKAGDVVKQTLELSITPDNTSILTNETITKVEITSNKINLPIIGIDSRTDGGILQKEEYEILRTCNLNFLRADIKFTSDTWIQNYIEACSNAKLLQLPLNISLYFGHNPEQELTEFIAQYNTHVTTINQLLIIDGTSYCTTNKLIETLTSQIKQQFPQAKIVFGTDGYFAEFNRNRFNAQLAHGVSFAISPQVHAFDNDSLVENIESQADAVLSAKAIYPGKEINVSPVTLRQRFNIVATGKPAPTPENELPYAVDERQMSLFAAGWTLGSIAALAKAGASAVTYFETHGWEGIIQGNATPQKPNLFKADAGQLFPIYHVLKYLLQFPQNSFYECKVSKPLQISALAINLANNQQIVIANHSNKAVTVVHGLKQAYTYCQLWANNVTLANNDPNFWENQKWETENRTETLIDAYAIKILKSKKS